MSEFLAKKYIPPFLIKEIVVRNEDVRTSLMAMLGDTVQDCQIKVDVKNKLFYRHYD